MLVTKQPVFRKFWYATVPMDSLKDGPKPFTLGCLSRLITETVEQGLTGDIELDRIERAGGALGDDERLPVRTTECAVGHALTRHRNRADLLPTRIEDIH